MSIAYEIRRKVVNVREAKGAERKEGAARVGTARNAKEEGGDRRTITCNPKGNRQFDMSITRFLHYYSSRHNVCVCTYAYVHIYIHTYTRWTRGAASRARGAARTRVIWRRQVIDSPSGDNAQPPTSLIVPRDGYRSNSVYFKGDRGRSGLEGPLDDGFSVTRTDPRLSTQTDPVNWYSAVHTETPTRTRARRWRWRRRWAATKNPLPSSSERDQSPLLPSWH